jgi:hypothetical protein
MKDPEKTVLKKVEPKNSPAAARSQRIGWTDNHPKRAGPAFAGFNLFEMESIEKLRTGPSNARLVMAHSDSQSNAIIAADKRNSAILGTSTLAISASAIA